MTAKKENAKTPHEKLCKVCNHPNREQIEKDYMNWTASMSTLAFNYKLTKGSLNTHINTFGLREKRMANKTMMLENIIDKGADIGKVNTSDALAAIKLDAQMKGEIIEKSEVKNTFGVDGETSKFLNDLGIEELKILLGEAVKLISKTNTGKVSE